MTTRAVSPFAAFDWLKRAINLGERNPKALLGAAGLLLAAFLLPSIVTMPVQYLAPRSTAGFVFVMAFSLLAGIALSPVIGGFLRVIHAVEQGQPARARDVFAPYRRGGGAGALMLLALVLMVFYVVVGAAMLASLGPGFWSWAQERAAAGMHAAPNVPPDVFAHFGRTMLLGLALWIFLSGFLAIGYGQVAIARRGIGGAIGDGVVGALKNLPALVVLAIATILLAIVAWVVVMIVVLVVGLIAKLLAPWLLLVFLVPLYLVVMGVAYVVMFGVAYYLWRDVCAGDAAGVDVQLATTQA
jgi:hypothetical protein